MNGFVLSSATLQFAIYQSNAFMARFFYVPKRLPLNNVAKACEMSESGHTCGKIVLKVSD